MTKFLIIGDLHGQMPKIHFKDFDAIIAPGDFCSDERRALAYRLMKENAGKKAKDLLDYEDLVGKRELKRLYKISLEAGRSILEKINRQRVPIFAVPGNWEPQDGESTLWKKAGKKPWTDYLIKNLDNVVDCHRKTIRFDGLKIIGNGYENNPEYPVKENSHWYSKPSIKKAKERFKTKFSYFSKKFRSKPRYPTIFLTHNVPYNTTIDIIRNKNSPMNGKHFGSYLARKLIEKHQPLVCIGGHMHEHFKKTKLGKTVCINAGFGAKVNVLLEIVNGKIKKTEFWDGSGFYRKK